MGLSVSAVTSEVEGKRMDGRLTSVHDGVGLSVSAVTTEVEGKRMDGRTDKRP